MMEDEPDRRCTHCGGAMAPKSTWDADDPGRAWQRMIRYQCRQCNVEGVLTIGKDRPNVTGGFVSEEIVLDEAVGI